MNKRINKPFPFHSELLVGGEWLDGGHNLKPGRIFHSGLVRVDDAYSIGCLTDSSDSNRRREQIPSCIQEDTIVLLDMKDMALVVVVVVELVDCIEFRLATYGM